MGQRIQMFNQSAQQELQRKQMDLMLPISEKAQAAVEKVAAANGFTYILDASASKAVVIYLDGGEDILPLVKAELGIN
jgi:outer membrane protein